MGDKKNIVRTICTILECVGIVGLGGIALWRNQAAYKAEIKAIDIQAERDLAKGLADIQKIEIDFLKKELSKKENED